jgi:hypothetical protein
LGVVSTPTIISPTHELCSPISKINLEKIEENEHLEKIEESKQLEGIK